MREEAYNTISIQLAQHWTCTLWIKYCVTLEINTVNEHIIIMKNNKEFKSTFEILKEIAAVQDKLSDIDKANVLEQLFGKRQANIGASILKNFDQANRALDASLNSAGSAATEHDRWMQSIEASENKAKTAVEEFSNAFMSSSLVKFSYDAKAGILGFLTEITEKIGALPLAASGLAGALSLKNKGNSNMNMPCSICYDAAA